MFVVKTVVFLGVALAASAFELGDRDVVFHLFTRLNPGTSQQMLPTLDSIVQASYFSLQRNTVITIHHIDETVAGNFNAFVVPAHLSAEDVNVISVDWSTGSGMYTQGLANAPQCAERIALFVNILIERFGYSANLVRIVGVGLGGHIAGIASRKISGSVPHIIALDPSFFGWTHHPDRLSPGDAGIVEVIHTTAGSDGYDLPLGDIDFYPNGGAVQNGCAGSISCSHILSYVFYAESITQTVNGGNAFVGTKCENYEDATIMQCSGERDATFGGTEVKESVSGIYVFLTNTAVPFARG